MQQAQTQQPDAVPDTTSTRTRDTVVADVYYLYLQNVCSGYKEPTTNSIVIGNCESYTHANDSAHLPTINSL